MRFMHSTSGPVEEPAEYRWGNQDSEDARLQIDFREFVQILFRQKKLIAATIFLVMFLAYIVVSSLTPRFTASTFIEINSRQTRIVDFETVLAGLSTDVETIQTEIEIIRSRNIAFRVIEKLDLTRDPEFNPALRSMALIQSWRYSLANWLIGDIVATPGGSQSESEEGTTGLVSFLDEIKHALAGNLVPPAAESSTEIITTREKDLVVDEFLRHLTISPENRSRIVRISFESESPETAAVAANAVADFYIVAQLEAKFEATKRATTWLNERVLQLRDEVVAKERTIEEFRANSGLLQGGRDATLASEQISELNAQRVQEIARLAEARARLRQADKLVSSPGGIESSVDVLQSPLIRSLRTEEAGVERQIAELAGEYGENHPTLKNARAELKDLQIKIRIEVERVIQGLRNEVAIASARAASLADSLEQHKQEIAQLNQAQVELRALELDANASRLLLESLLERTKQTASQENFQQADANIVSSAAVPRGPSFPHTVLILWISFVFGIMLSVSLAFVIERWDTGLRSGEEASRILRVKTLALLPSVSKISAAGKAPQDYILNHPDSAYGEGIRTLFTNLLLTDVKRRPKVVMITSAVPSEGKTVVALSLGRLLAKMDYRVVVVDCDLRNPMTYKELGVEPGPGLVDCLASGTPIEEVIQQDKGSEAHILQVGNFSGSYLARFDSNLMQGLLRQLGRKYEIVLLDSPPILAVSDGLFLASLVDKIIFLVRWAKTRRVVAKLGLEQALTAHGDVAGVALTMVNVKAHASYDYGDSGVYHGKLRKYYTG